MGQFWELTHLPSSLPTYYILILFKDGFWLTLYYAISFPLNLNSTKVTLAAKIWGHLKWGANFFCFFFRILIPLIWQLLLLSIISKKCLLSTRRDFWQIPSHSLLMVPNSILIFLSHILKKPSPTNIDAFCILCTFISSIWKRFHLTNKSFSILNLAESFANILQIFVAEFLQKQSLYYLLKLGQFCHLFIDLIKRFIELPYYPIFFQWKNCFFLISLKDIPGC